METVQTLTRRLAVAETIHTIVRNMKTLALASIRHYEEAAGSLARYAETVEMGLQIALRSRSPGDAEAPPNRGAGLVVFGSSLGLAGRFNERIATFAGQWVREAGSGELRILALGGYLGRRFEAAGLRVEQELPLPTSVAGIAQSVQELLQEIEAWRDQGVAETTLCFNARADEAPFQPRVVRLLPLDADWLRRLRQRPWPTNQLPTHTMDWRPLFSALVREHLFVTLYHAFAESLAAEQTNRLASMQAAERNIERRLDELRRAYHERRQTAITEELLDIVSGWEVMSAEESAP